MARTKRFLIALVVVVVIYIISRLLAFAQLFGVLREHAGIKITQGEVAAAHDQASPDLRPQVIPKILHQIFHNWNDPRDETPPPHWAAARQTCIDLNPEWEHKIWSEETSREFLLAQFPWFVSTYDNYEFRIQRIDVIRYFLLRHYGGIYLDMDNGCAANLDPLTYYPAFTTSGGHGALSNNIMGGQPGHPWFNLLTENLISWDWNWRLPYVIISYDSGKWFVTAMVEKYMSLLSKDGKVRGFHGTWAPLHHILMDMRPGADPWVFFTQVHGGTWTNWDSPMFSWIGDNIILLALGVVAITGSVIQLCTWYVRRRTKKPTKEYQSLDVEEHDLT